mgnify:CR=1 FL=1
MKTILIATIILCSYNSNITKVSWYGPGFDGRITANGEIYSQDSLTAASPNLPFNTLVKITNPSNNKSVVVRINDRGPFKCFKKDGKIRPVRPLEPHPKRKFDLSKKAFETIASTSKGIIQVEYKLIK